MAKLLRGALVRDLIADQLRSDVMKLKENGVCPKVATLRVGDRSGDMYYENAIRKNSDKYGIECVNRVYTEEASQEELEEGLAELNGDPSIHGIIMLMPFPKFVNEARMKRLLAPEKDIDAITDASYANLFDAKKPLDDYFCACTAEACMEILQKNDVELQGKKVTIVGRSVRIGKPLMLMMLNANATVTVCHTRTKPEDLKEACEAADIVVLATGQIESYGPEFFHEGQIIVDAGAGTGSDGKMAGDLNAKALTECEWSENVAYTPVPGGVGTVTTTLLLRNVMKAAKHFQKRENIKNLSIK